MTNIKSRTFTYQCSTCKGVVNKSITLNSTDDPLVLVSKLRQKELLSIAKQLNFTTSIFGVQLAKLILSRL